MDSSVITLKLLVNTRSKKVVFAEAGKDFVDFLFSLLSLPLGAVIDHLGKSRMVGSLGNIYGSLENLSQEYMLPNRNKNSLLKPDPPASAAAGVPLLRTSVGQSSGYLFGSPGWNQPAAGGGYVKSAVIYMVSDDLVVKPLSPISGISIFKYYIEDIAVEEKMVHVTRSEGLKLLKASLETKDVLTTVFLSDN